ncbi:RidA family protein [Corynebacterium ulceribovis]|uniref:RidA family protein n=1 Tax=Corynebacterium ulceribovis TaxID=487732 RepID=UPI00035FC486|nr:RidA family protein [Corynebacterium ulceribovis]
MSSWFERLKELGIELPQVAAPVAAYVPAIQVGQQVWTSGQLPFVDGELPVVGKVADTTDIDVADTSYVSVDKAKEQARIATLNALAAVDSLVGLDNVARVVKVVGFVSSAAGFHGQPGVVNGASELLGEIFGEAGQHARSAVGVAELPLNSPVEIELIVELAAERP